MAEANVPSIKLFKVDTDFCSAFKLQEEKVIKKGMCGEIILTKFKDHNIVVKKFTLLDKETNDKNTSTFFKEIKLMQTLKHQFVMKCVIAGQCPEYQAIGMDYFHRGTLLNYVGDIGVDLSELCITQVACALRYLHKNHVVHMDVKLDNILLNSEFNAILGDFGLAMEMSPQQTMLKKRFCGGTPSYFAPEHVAAQGDNELDIYKLDSYCLGVVMWALFLQRYPKMNINYFMQAMKRRDLPSHIRMWILKMVNRDPIRRPTVTDFLIRLRQEGSYRHVIDNN